MGYARYDIGDGLERGYAIEDVCNYKGCTGEIHRGLSYLCYGCEKYFCEEHLTRVYDEQGRAIEVECFAGKSGQICHRCAVLFGASAEDLLES